MTEVHDVTIAEAVEKMADWLTRHYHQREANLARDPVAVYAQAQFEPDEVHCYQELNDWTRENSEVAEVYPEYAAAYADLLTACKAAAEWHAAFPHDNAIFDQQTSAEVERQLVAAIRKARGHDAGD